jgi:hypothetical protein
LRKLTAVAAVAVAGLGLAACTSGSSSTTSGGTASSSGCKNGAPPNIAAPAGYQVCLFVAPTTSSNHPDSVIVNGSNVFVGWQNVTAKDGTDNKTSTISQYTTDGKLVKSWSVKGHNDGLRMDPYTHLLWVMCDEDGNPRLYIINPSVSTPTQITLPSPTPWGGGFDDIQFVGGNAYIDASNPTLNAAGKNVFAALYQIHISGTTAKLTKVLNASTKATTINLPATSTTLNLTDPDSMMIDPTGTLVLDSQGDSEMLWIKNPGTPQQSVTVLSVGTQVDDTVWAASAKGCILVSDNGSGVYTICSSVWVPGTAYVTAPNDSTVIGFVGTLNLSTGLIQPIVAGFSNPHGMAWLPK